MSQREIPCTRTDVISCVRFDPSGSLLLVAGWDGLVQIFGDDDEGQKYSKSVGHESDWNVPILDVAWRSDCTSIYGVGLNQQVIKQSTTLDDTISRSILSANGKASNKVAYSKEHDLVLSTSWDETMHVHGPEPGTYVVIKLAAKPLALSLTSTYAVVAMTERKVHVYDLATLKVALKEHGSTDEDQKPIEIQPWQQRESSLKFMTRDLTCMPDGTGFASSSIEGRVGVEWFDEEANKQVYAFKCHRDKSTVTVKNEETGEQETESMDIIYPVNAVAFHPVHGTFATGGGDGVVALWDAKTKRRVRQYPKLPACVAALEFSPDGKYLAIAISPGFEDDKIEEDPDPNLIKVYIRELAEGEAKGKPAKAAKDEIKDEE